VTGEADAEGAPVGRKAIVIPLDDERILGEFIASLLGQRRSIECDFHDRRFDIDLNWLLNLNEIILQRITSQHAAKLMSFSARFYFESGRIITLEDEKSFRHYNDISSEISVGVDLRWSFLIKFPLVDVPEKQEIRFATFTDESILGEKQSTKYATNTSFVSLRENDERLYYTILFTNVTWGEDLSATVAAYIAGKTDALPRWKKYLRIVPITVIVPVTLGVGLLYGMVTSLNTLSTQLDIARSSIMLKYGDIEKLPATLNTVDQKLSFLVDSTITTLYMKDILSFWPFIKSALCVPRCHAQLHCSQSGREVL
jgi:hypothetical protein